ncbi:MAG: hypothetical protein ABSG84_14970 [Acidobacteriaceae bacterium]
MRITILNGEPEIASTFEEYLSEVARQLAASGNAVTTLDLRELDLRGCSGCFAVDQMIGLLHPNFIVEGGEVHHRARYAHYPKFGLLLDAGSDSDAEDIEITTALWTRTARNMKSSMIFTAVSNRSAKEVANEIALAA